jgi:hypothetical protein
LIDRLREGEEMMVRLVSCRVRECKQAGSNRWIRERERERDRDITIKERKGKERKEEQ